MTGPFGEARGQGFSVEDFRPTTGPPGEPPTRFRYGFFALASASLTYFSGSALNSSRHPEQHTQ